MQLQNRNAIIYGGGAVGSAVAKAFAREGANVVLAGRTLAAVQDVASAIGASAQAAEIDALDESAIEKHFASVVEAAGKVDISFNAVGIRNTKLQGVALTHLDVAGRTHAKRLPSLLEMANVAAFAASDSASALTGTIINLSLGNLDD
ncbi:SDR family oxidoreductase [Rhizobium leguminosarum]|nr:SDR family oxidoreductase [Rhizobium leguminosarum bv. viciae]